MVDPVSIWNVIRYNDGREFLNWIENVLENVLEDNISRDFCFNFDNLVGFLWEVEKNRLWGAGHQGIPFPHRLLACRNGATIIQFCLKPSDQEYVEYMASFPYNDILNITCNTM